MKSEKFIWLSTDGLDVGFRSRYSQKLLFKNLNLSLKAGELVCFMGPNGSGKSSLIRTLSGLQKELGGTVQLNTEEKNIPKTISVVLTSRVIGAVTVRELVTYGRYPYLSWNVSLNDNDKKIIESAIDRVGIGYLADKQISELSDGQVQMAMIARALAQDTPVILLDEPTAHLDLNNRVEMMKLLRGLCRDTNKAILVATHELDLALQTADRVWLCGRERNIHSGIPEDLVLDGSFDDIFQFKGFDLKTGKIQQDSYRGTTIYIDGEGSEYLWTRNALERSGLKVAGTGERGEGSALKVKVVLEESKPRWILEKNNQLFNLSSIAELIEML